MDWEHGNNMRNILRKVYGKGNRCACTALTFNLQGCYKCCYAGDWDIILFVT